MSQSDTISLYRPLLCAIALKMTGRMADAEDLVQDTFLNWIRVDPASIQNTKSYLIKSVKNACSNHLKSLATKKDLLIESFKSCELSMPIYHPVSEGDVMQEIQKALQLLHHKLKPAEKALFLLREVFDVDYGDLSDYFNKTSENCRKIVSRAKSKLKSTELFEHPRIELEALFSKFKSACDLGELTLLIDKLKKDITEKFSEK